MMFQMYFFVADNLYDCAEYLNSDDRNKSTGANVRVNEVYSDGIDHQILLNFKKLDNIANSDNNLSSLKQGESRFR